MKTKHCTTCNQDVHIADYHEDASMCVDCINEIADKGFV